MNQLIKMNQMQDIYNQYPSQKCPCLLPFGVLFIFVIIGQLQLLSRQRLRARKLMLVNIKLWDESHLELVKKKCKTFGDCNLRNVFYFNKQTGDGQQVYNCKTKVIIQIQPVMRNENPGHLLSSNCHINRKAKTKFAFTNSSKVLPKQHTADQFSSLIQWKKNCQSLIKEQISKLELININVLDPEVEPFCANDEGLASGQIPNQYYKLELKNGTSLLLNAKIQKSIKSVRQNKQIDRYLEQKVNSGQLNILERGIKMRSVRSFLVSLKLFHEMINKQKAARFYEYQKLTRKCFFGILKFSNQIFIDENAKEKELIFKIFILRRSFNQFILTIKNQRLIKRSQDCRKTKQLMTKKLYINYFQRQIKSRKCIREKTFELQEYIKKKSLYKFVKLQKYRQKIKKQGQFLIEQRKKGNFIDLVMKLKQNKSESRDILNNFIVEYEQKYQKGDMHYNQNYIEIYAKNKKMSAKSKQKLKTQIKSKVLASIIVVNAKCKQGKLFLKLLGSNKNIQVVKNLQNINHKLLTYKNLFIFQFISNAEHQKKISKIFTHFLLRYMRNFRENVSNDIQYKKSLANVTGTKQWLMRNKRIFKSEPIKQSQISAQNLKTGLRSELGVQFRNPIQKMNQMDLLYEESKFRKLMETRQKKLFINTLKKRMTIKRKQEALSYAFKQVSDRKLIKKVWENWNDKQKMREVMMEIDEEIAHQLNEEQQILCIQLNNRTDKFNKIKLIKRLSQAYKFYSNQKKLQFSIFEKFKGNLLSKLKLIKRSQQMHNQTRQNFEKVSEEKKKYEWKKLTRLLRQNLLMSTLQKQKQTMMCKQLFLERVKQNQMEKKDWKEREKFRGLKNYLEKGMSLVRNMDKKSFIRLLNANKKIAKGSIRVTSFYVSQTFSQMRTYKSRLTQIRQIKIKQNELRKIIRIKSYKQSLQQFKNNHAKSSIMELIESLSLQRKRKVQIEFLKTLFLYSIDFKLRKEKMQKMNEVKKNHSNIEKRELFVRLNRIVNKREIRQMNQLDVNVDTRILQNKNTEQNGFQKYLNKQMIQGHQLQKQSQSSFNSQSQNSSQLRVNIHFEGSHGKQQFIQQHSEEEIPYEKYRESLQIEKRAQSKPLEIITNQQREQVQQENNKLNFCKGNQQIDSEESNLIEESNLTNEYNDKYFENRNNSNVLKRYFKEWKLKIKQKKQLDQELIKKTFNGLKRYARQKSLVKKYLKQYEQQLHYYPQSIQEYQQFRAVVQNS